MGRYGQLGLLRRPDAGDRQVVKEALRLVGATHLAQRPIGHLSGGEQQRVAIARALAQQPDIFLLDEPTASLDFRARSEIMGLVRQIHLMKGLTTLYVTHDLASLPENCNRVVLMKEGLIWRWGTPKETLSNDNLSWLFDLSPEEVRTRWAEITIK
jgi:ABC-type cobalamin/Fe3+-siderophores transport system ATPase subunit